MVKLIALALAVVLSAPAKQCTKEQIAQLTADYLECSAGSVCTSPAWKATAVSEDGGLFLTGAHCEMEVRLFGVSRIFGWIPAFDAYLVLRKPDIHKALRFDRRRRPVLDVFIEERIGPKTTKVTRLNEFIVRWGHGKLDPAFGATKDPGMQRAHRASLPITH